MPGKLWKPLKATTQRHKGKKAGFDTRIGSPTSSSDFIIKPVVELDFDCRHIQRLKRRSLAPLGRNSHTRLHNESVLVPSTSTRAIAFPPSLLACCIHVHTCAHSCFFFFEVEAFSACKRARWHTCPQYTGTPVIQAASCKRKRHLEDATLVTSIRRNAHQHPETWAAYVVVVLFSLCLLQMRWVPLELRTELVTSRPCRGTCHRTLFVCCVLLCALFCRQVCRTCMQISSSYGDNNAGETSRGMSSLCCFSSAFCWGSLHLRSSVTCRYLVCFGASAAPKFGNVSPSTFICRALNHI